MTAQRWAWTHTYAVPMFVVSVILVSLSGAALAAVLVIERTGGEGSRFPGGGDGSPPASHCLVGTWQVVEHGQEVPMPLFGTGRLDLVGAGPVFEFRADGTGRADYGEGTQFETISLGEPVPVSVSGHVDFRYEVSGGSFRLTEATSRAQARVSVVGPMAWELATEPVAHNCEADVATFERPGYSATYHRLTG